MTKNCPVVIGIIFFYHQQRGFFYSSVISQKTRLIVIFFLLWNVFFYSFRVWHVFFSFRFCRWKFESQLRGKDNCLVEAVKFDFFFLYGGEVFLVANYLNMRTTIIDLDMSKFFRLSGRLLYGRTVSHSSFTCRFCWNV